MQEPWPYAIRPMEPGDIPSVVAIDRLSFPTPWSASSYAYELKRRNVSLFYVLLRPDSDGDSPPKRGWRRWLYSATGRRTQSRVIGYLGIRLRGSGTHISTLAIHPGWRGKGLGELLLLTAIEQSAKMGRSVITLEVRPSNQIAQRLYQKYGFRFTGVHEGYYRDGENAWLMAVEIDQDAYRARLAKLRQEMESRLYQHSSESHSVKTHVGQIGGGKL